MLVHGIGNQKPGSLLEKWAEPCADALATLAESRRFAVSREPPQRPRVEGEPHSMMVSLDRAGRTRKVLITEAIWSDAFERPSLRRCLIWAVRSLPAAVLLFAPDHRDTALLEDDGPVSFRTEIRRRLECLLRGRLTDTLERVGLRLTYRILIGVLLVGLLLVAIIDFPPLAGLLAVLALAYLASAKNVVGHVVVAASEPSELDRIRSRVRERIDWALERCDQVLIVAHSQGGFICHSVLNIAADPPPPKRVRGLIGVGSGLKPIWLLQQMSRPKIAAAVWITTIATAIGEASIVSLLSGADPSLTAATRNLIELGAHAALPLGALSLESALDAFPNTEAIPLIGLPDSFRHPGLLPVIGLGVFFAGWLISRRVWREASADVTERSPRAMKIQRWFELSSYHDPVGRLLFPTLPPPATERAVAVGGHPIGDHVAYFRRSSVLPWMVAGEVMKAMKIRPQRDISDTTAALQLSAERRRVLRSGLFLAVLFGGTLPAVAGGRPLFDAIASLALVLLGISLVLSLTFLAMETMANRRTLDALRRSVGAGDPVGSLRLPTPAAKRRAPAFVALAVSILAYCVVFSLADYPSHDESTAGEFLLLAVLFAIYCVAIVAGYRPSRWLLVLIVYFTISHYLSRVPPWPHPPAFPEFLAIPAIPAIVFVACGMCVLFVLLRPKRLSARDAAP